MSSDLYVKSSSFIWLSCSWIISVCFLSEPTKNTNDCPCTTESSSLTSQKCDLARNVSTLSVEAGLPIIKCCRNAPWKFRCIEPRSERGGINICFHFEDVHIHICHPSPLDKDRVYFHKYQSIQNEVCSRDQNSTSTIYDADLTAFPCLILSVVSCRRVGERNMLLHAPSHRPSWY